MTTLDFIALLPLLITAYVGTMLMAVVAFWRNNWGAFAIALIGFAVALGSVFVALSHAPVTVTPLLRIDSYSLYFAGLILVAALLITLLVPEYLPVHQKRTGPFYALLMFAVLGMLAIATSAHFISFFLGVEVLSVSLYGLVGYTRRWKISLEGAAKYLVLAAASSAFLLFGIALIYAEYGSMNFRLLAPLMAGHPFSLVTLFGLALVLVGIGFKLALVPFHTWSPDVYQGAPAPVTALIATGSKGAVFALLLRLVVTGNLVGHPGTYLMFAILAVMTMTVGNLLALLQNNVKRLLAYSSVAQIGYLLIPLLTGSYRGHWSIVFYLSSYFATSILAFGVIAGLSSSATGGDIDDMDDYRGLIRRRPLPALGLSLALLSLTGIPLTAGFFAKVFIFTAAADVELWWLLVVGVVNSGVSAYYYLRLLVTMYMPEEPSLEHTSPVRPVGAVALVLAAGVVVVFGFYPSPLAALALAAARQIGF